MTRIIPEKELEKFIKSTGWVPGQEPFKSKTPPITEYKHSSEYGVDDILKGQQFYDDNLPDALQQALDYVGVEGVVASMPYLIAGKSQAGKSNYLWKDWFTALSEENIGVDKSGKFVAAGNPVVVTVHGGGLLTPERIKQAYSEGLINGSAKYSDDEFSNLLEGRLPSGDLIELYSFEKIKEGVSDLSHRFGVVMPYSTAQNTESGYHKKKDFIQNPLVIARAGGIENLEAYFDKAKDSDGEVGNHHPFKNRDASVPQGRVLFLNSNYNGLCGSNNLDSDGRFVGVAPEAP
ncbi:MAG: hypothetical protein ISS23_02735 [Nanoarchaeota archaeon]|nr:hypothetical protein [Nanoarchaeota archaeon]